jgi:uncharacterized membrane protein HdeD (DUF308 family)
MRWLKQLIPENIKNSLNSNPGFQWLVIVLMVVVGILLIITGINGIKTKRLKSKDGRVFEGTTAQILGIVYVILGVALPLVAIAALLNLN